MAAAAGVTTPYRGYRVLDASLTHTGDMDSFENNAKLRVNQDR